MSTAKFCGVLGALLVLAVAGGCDDLESTGAEPLPDIEETGCGGDEECEGTLVCDLYLNDGAGECVVCVADLTSCEGDFVQTCLPDGSGYGELESCLSEDPCQVSPGCVDGVCLPIEAKDCDDANACTVDLCQPTSGECLNFPNQDPGCCTEDAQCDDGLSCTQDTCDTLNGICSNVGGPCSSLITQWGEKGDGDGQLKFPAGIAVLASGEVAVADTGNSRVSLFSREGVFSRHLDAEIPESPLSSPSGMAVFDDGRLAVADTSNDRIVIFNEDGTFAQSLTGNGELDGPTDVAISADQESVWVVNNPLDNVMQVSLTDSVQRTLGETGDSPGKFRRAFSIELDANGNVYVTDKELNRVQLLDPISEEALIVYGETGANEGQFDQIGGIVRMWTGDVIVADPENKRVQFISPCTPVCEEGAECGFNGCGGVCGACMGAATCEGGICVGEFLGGTGCFAGSAPTCGDCECQECACAADGYCCDTAWDDVCVGICVNDCLAACPDTSIEPELTPVLTHSTIIDDQFLAPIQVFVDSQTVLWVVDSVASKITSFQLTP